MLQLSDNAAAALENIRESQGIPDEQGTRLTADEGPDGTMSLRLEFVEDVPEGDEIVEQSGTEIHLDPRVVQPLADTIMDVRDSEGGLTFVFESQAS